MKYSGKSGFAPLLAVLLAVALMPFCAPALAAQKDGGVSFNFVDVEITAVAKYISDVTGTNFIYDDRVKGKVTIVAPSKLSREDAYALFTSVLQFKGFALVPSGVDAFKIVPLAEARQYGLTFTEGPQANDDFIARLIRIQHISTEEALRFVQPIISRNGYISAFGAGNLILVMDSGLNVEKVLKIIEAIDRPYEADAPDYIPLRFADAADIAAVLNDAAAKSAQQRGAQPTAKAVADKRLNALVLFGSKADKASMRRLIELMDIKPGEDKGAINVYFLENAEAEEMAKVLQGLLADKGRAAASPFQGLGNVIITPDKGTNALVIVASPSDYASLMGIIKQLDRRRRQVYVEALIVEASLDNLRDLGAKWRVTGTHDGEPLVVGGVGKVDSNTMQGIIYGLSGVTVGGAGNYMNYSVPDPTNPAETKTITAPGFAALFSMSEFKGAVNVLSSPQILTADNTKAEIHVGENVPFITKTETAATGFATNSIERKDVGIKLEILPQITEGESVKLELYQEISSVKESTAKEASEVGPTTTKRSTRTTVIVQDGRTVVISGLMQERTEEVETRVPLLHRIPILGWLFKYRSSTKLKTNLLVFLTPHIINDASDLGDITSDKQKTFARQENMLVPGHIVVRFREGIEDTLALSIIETHDASLVEKQKDGGFAVRLLEPKDAEGVVEDLLKVPEVTAVEPFYKLKTF